MNALSQVSDRDVDFEAPPPFCQSDVRHLEEITADAPPPPSILSWLQKIAGWSCADLPAAKRLFYIVAIGMTKLRRPLKVEVEAGEERGFVAYAPAIRVGGFGGTAEAAIADMAWSAGVLYAEFTKAAPEQLHPSARAQLAKLRSFLG